MKISIHSGDKKIKSPESELLFYLLVFAGLWLYIWLRAIFTQMTHDETANFFRFVHTGDFLPYGLDTSATNHILNSLLAWVFYSLFGAEPVVLRLSNVLFFPMFFYFLVRFAGLMRSRFLRIGFVVVVALAHNLIEFFAMSRGYGQSMALLLGAICFLMQAFQKPTVKNYLLTLLFAVFALSANLTLLNSVILIIGFLMLRLLSQKQFKIRQTLTHWLIILIVGIVPFIFFAAYLFHLKSLGDLYYGEASGFWNITVKSLIRTMLDPGWPIIGIFVVIYLFGILFTELYLLFSKSSFERLFDPVLLFFYFLVGNVVAVFLLNVLFGVNFPEDRTGLYFLVYFIGSIFFFTDRIAFDFKPKAILLAVVPLFIFPVHFFININLSHNSFEDQTIPLRFYEKMVAEHDPGEIPPTIGGYRGRELRWAFLNFRHGGVLGKLQGSLFHDTLADYHIADTSYPDSFRKIYDAVDYHTNSMFTLLKRRQQPACKLVHEKSEIKTNGKLNELYYRFFIFDADTLAGKSVRIDFDLHFNTEAKPFIGWLIANTLADGDRQTAYEYFPLEWLRTNWEGDNGRVKNSIMVKLPDEINQLNFYIWNKREVPFSVDDGWVRVWVFE